MNSILIAAVGVVYLVISIDSAIKGQLGLAISFLGYSLGNVGLFMMSR